MHDGCNVVVVDGLRCKTAGAPCRLWGVVRRGDSCNTQSPVLARAELQRALRGLQLNRPGGGIPFVTDSELVYMGLTGKCAEVWNIDPVFCVFHPIWVSGQGVGLLNGFVTNELIDCAPSLFKVPCR